MRVRGKERGGREVDNEGEGQEGEVFSPLGE